MFFSFILCMRWGVGACRVEVGGGRWENDKDGLTVD